MLCFGFEWVLGLEKFFVQVGKHVRTTLYQKIAFFMVSGEYSEPFYADLVHGGAIGEKRSGSVGAGK